MSASSLVAISITAPEPSTIARTAASALKKPPTPLLSRKWSEHWDLAEEERGATEATQQQRPVDHEQQDEDDEGGETDQQFISIADLRQPHQASSTSALSSSSTTSAWVMASASHLPRSPCSPVTATSVAMSVAPPEAERPIADAQALAVGPLAPATPTGSMSFTPPPPPTARLLEAIEADDDEAVQMAFRGAVIRWCDRVQQWIDHHPKERPVVAVPIALRFPDTISWLKSVSMWYQANFSSRCEQLSAKKSSRIAARNARQVQQQREDESTHSSRRNSTFLQQQPAAHPSSQHFVAHPSSTSPAPSSAPFVDPRFHHPSSFAAPACPTAAPRNPYAAPVFHQAYYPHEHQQHQSHMLEPTTLPQYQATSFAAASTRPAGWATQQHQQQHPRYLQSSHHHHHGTYQQQPSGAFMPLPHLAGGGMFAGGIYSTSAQTTAGHHHHHA